MNRDPDKLRAMQQRAAERYAEKRKRKALESGTFSSLDAARQRAGAGEPRTTPLRSTLARSGPIKPKKRSPKERRRIYGPKEREAAVRAMPCAACGRVGYSVNAHLAILGTGIKADADTIAPLCDYVPDGKGGTARGCHAVQEGKRPEGADLALGLAPGTLRAAAERVEALYPTRDA